MKRIVIVFCIVLGLAQCVSDSEEGVRTFCFMGPCDVHATIRDLRGLDGCGFVLEVNDSTRLEPVEFERMFAPADPDQVEWVDGKKVVIGYEELTDVASVCMAGLPVRIICIIEVPTTEEQ